MKAVEKLVSIWEKDGKEVRAYKVLREGYRPMFTVKTEGNEDRNFGSELKLFEELTSGNYEFISEVE